VKRRLEIFQELSRSFAFSIRYRFAADSALGNYIALAVLLTIDPEKFGKERDAVNERSRCCGIETRPFFIPLHTLPPFREASALRREKLPVTELIAARGMNLPTYPAMTLDDVNGICDALSASAGK